MSFIVYIDDHADLAEAALPQQYAGLPNIVAQVRNFGDRMQTLEDVFWDMLNNGSIVDQHDSLLDQTGDIVVQPRNGLDDAQYRLVLFAKVAQNVSNGTPEELIRIFKILMQADRIVYNPLYPAAFSLTAIGGTPLGTLDSIKDAIIPALTAGVSIDLFRSVDSVSFSFSDDPDPNGQGFGDVNDPTVGGYLAQIF